MPRACQGAVSGLAGGCAMASDRAMFNALPCLLLPLVLPPSRFVVTKWASRKKEKEGDAAELVTVKGRNEPCHIR